MIEEVCFGCQKSPEETPIHKCPTCFRRFCDEHAHRMSGRLFCTKGCAHHFFFASPDNEDDADDG